MGWEEMGEKMRIFITGAGRGGTTLAREVIIGLGLIKFYCDGQSKEEDRNFFKRKELPENYGTKLTTPTFPGEDDYTIGNLGKLMNKYDDLYVVFSFRNPIDTCMSKIVRGQKHSDGGDKYWEGVSPDGTVKDAIRTVKLMYGIYDAIKGLFPKRVYVIKMENLILHPEEEIGKVAKFFGVGVTSRALVFYRYNSNPYQFRRYGTAIDKSQVDLYKKWDTAYGGFFKDRKKDIDKIREAFNAYLGQ